MLTCAAAIATRDRPASLARLVGSLLAQTRRPRQIILVDDGELGPDWRDEWSARCRDAGVEWVYRRKRPPGRSASRNVAAELADADAIVFFDDDCEPAPDFLDKLMASLQHERGAALIAVEGETRPPAGWRAGDRIYRVASRLIGWWGLPLRAHRGGPWPQGVAPRRMLDGVCAVRRSAFMHERFDEALTLGEDREFSIRLGRHGGLGRVAGAVCLHHQDPAGRVGQFALGLRIARCYLYAQGKLFGWRGRLCGAASLTGMAMLELGLTLGGRVGHAARSAGIVAGLFTPGGPRGERQTG